MAGKKRLMYDLVALKLRLKQIGGIVFNTFFFAVTLFVPAGTIRWPRAWIFLGVVSLGTALTMFVLPEELLNERYKPPVQYGQPLFDQIGIFAFVGSFVAAVLFIPFDVFRLHLLRPPGTVTSIFGLALFAAGWTLITVAMRANAFAAPVVRHQEERGQRVIDSGPYRFVRHPMYSAVIPLLVGMSLWLGSFAGAIVAIVPTVLIGIRAMLEEKFLCRELPGYAEYITRTRFRMIPYVW
ncbi:MAG: isoprenylcysteine carboxylmethyltransferase family protein [Deltaproteobacteria bacterium]|nr:isoprenylcysteine carboxylmethyltransferase family protein [Deltaproteobacteria bacterium]